MAEVKNGGEPTLPLKRNADLSYPESKKQMVENPDRELDTAEDYVAKNGSKGLESDSDAKNDVILEKKEAEPEAEVPKEGVEQEDVEEKEKSNGQAVIDRKGKGILIEEDEDIDCDDDEDDDSDDDDSSDEDGGENLSGDESDFSDDPLTEVDLDNILPSRTRRRVVNPGAYIANDLGNHNGDDSDDSDA